MGLHFEHHRQAVADVDGSGIFSPDAGQSPGRPARQEPQQGSGVFISAVFTPERAEHAQLNRVGLAVQAVQYQLVLRRAEGYLIQHFFGDRHQKQCVILFAPSDTAEQAKGRAYYTWEPGAP